MIRLGLRQFAAGMLSILVLGILNRVMKVEMGLPLGLIGLVIGIHYFAALVAIPYGHRSDSRPFRGFHRTPYILAGATLTVLATAAAPFGALWMQDQAGSPASALLTGLIFLAFGFGIYSAGTAYLSLLADLTHEDLRPRAVSIIWSMMMLGILAGVFLGVWILDAYSPDRLVILFLIVGVSVAVLTVTAVAGTEPRGGSRAASNALPLRHAWGLLQHSQQTRRFFLFLMLGIFFLFLQQVVLEPYGGDVFGLDIRATTLFNAYQMVGVLSGMAVAGGWLARRIGNKLTAGAGLVLASLSFALLAISSWLHQPGWLAPAIVVMGLGMGLFNIGGLALMMGMAVNRLTGLYMGAWTLAQALGNGLASVGGGLLFALALRILGDQASAYASVFVIEAIGLLATTALLGRISLSVFRRETESSLQTSPA
ncbi:MAG: BCD family MFS transporter [Anaerolineales bacterium]|nr:BCD family MFS transporter [Anaerolineales bacterium]